MLNIYHHFWFVLIITFSTLQYHNLVSLKYCNIYYINKFFPSKENNTVPRARHFTIPFHILHTRSCCEMKGIFATSHVYKSNVVLRPKKLRKLWCLSKEFLNNGQLWRFNIFRHSKRRNSISNPVGVRRRNSVTNRPRAWIISFPVKRFRRF